MKVNKKGFTIVELLVALTILVTLSAVLVPALYNSMLDARRKTDKAAIANLETNIQMGLQHNSMYKDAKKIAEDTVDKKIVFIYRLNEDKILVLDECKANNESTGESTSKNDDELGLELADLKQKLDNYVNGKIEPIELTSEDYFMYDYHISITFPDVEFKVRLETEQVPKEISSHRS